MNQSSVSLLRSRAVLGAGFMVWRASPSLTQCGHPVALDDAWLPAGLDCLLAIRFCARSFPAASVSPRLEGDEDGLSRPSHPARPARRVWCAGLGTGLATVPIWQAIALVMTSPFFIIIGARLFLGETVGRDRWLATLTGFIGAMIILQPWSDSFTLAALLPCSRRCSGAVLRSS